MISLTDDLEHFDGLETVSLRPASGGAPTPLSYALRRRVTTHEAAASNGAYLQGDVRWYLSTAELAEPPTPGAVITDDASANWTVLRVDRGPLATAWRCWSRNLELVEGLSQLVTLQKAQWTADAAGAPLAVWTDDRVGLRARIQPQHEIVEIRHQQRTARVTHKIYLAEQLPLDDNYRVVHDNAAYRVLGYEMPQRIDQLLTINAERVPWPL